MSNPDLKALRQKAATQYPHWCLVLIAGGPDPRVIDHSHRYGHFIRFPKMDHIYNIWCFTSASQRDAFCKEYVGTPCDVEA